MAYGWAGRPRSLPRHQMGWRRRLLVAGAGPGVGTTTVAASFGGTDAGLLRSGTADVLVCSTDEPSLRTAWSQLRRIRTAGLPTPALAIVNVQGHPRARDAGRAHRTALQEYRVAVIRLPHVRACHFDGAASAPAETRETGARSARHTRELAAFADEIRQLVATLGAGEVRMIDLGATRPAPTSADVRDHGAGHR